MKEKELGRRKGKERVIESLREIVGIFKCLQYKIGCKRKKERKKENRLEYFYNKFSYFVIVKRTRAFDGKNFFF